MASTTSGGTAAAMGALAWTTGPDARLYRRSPGTGAALCFIGHALIENRGGLIIQGEVTQAHSRAERQAALDMGHRHFPGSTRKLTLGADKRYDAAEFAADLRQVGFGAETIPRIVSASNPRMSRRNRDCQRLTAAPPGMTAALCPGNTASQAKRSPAGPEPSAARRKPCIAAP